MTEKNDAVAVKAALRDSAYERKYGEGLEEFLREDFPLEELLEMARQKTREHFPPATEKKSAEKHRIKLFAPLYLANICVNHCRYCGFQHNQKILRRHLTFPETCLELDVLQQRKFRQILLVAGENPKLCTTDYFCEIIREIRRREMVPAVEIAPQTTESYAAMAEAGNRSITLFQETYDEEKYRLYHPQGPKSSFDWRIATYDRAGEGGFRFFGFGILLGLAEPRAELRRMMRQAWYLSEKFPLDGISFSLPRIRVAPNGFQPPYPVDDTLFIRFYAILRRMFPRAELVLSTRETVEMRNRLYESCITYTSAGSHTDPGGYYAESTGQFSGEQFPITDHRSVEDLTQWLTTRGFDVRF
ncbi:MAG: radical SAM protein [Planctomycetia bacterium]|nr:radical SAM protein [Planctomycetia bacterium]